MAKHRNSRARLPKRPSPTTPTPASWSSALYGDPVELEGIAVTADECVTSLPVFPTGKYKRTPRRLYVLVGATAGRASEVLERSEDMLAQLAGARGDKRPPMRRVR
jgi:hypothetical protein